MCKRQERFNVIKSDVLLRKKKKNNSMCVGIGHILNSVRKRKKNTIKDISQLNLISYAVMRYIDLLLLGCFRNKNPVISSCY